MSARTEPSPKRGTALLLAIVITAVTAICVLSLWRTTAAARRWSSLESAHVAAQSLADSANVLALQSVDSGGWRALTTVGQSAALPGGSGRRSSWRVQFGRSGWMTLISRSSAAVRTGVPGLTARADRRTLIPLIAPLDVPTAALTGDSTWSIDAAAVVDVSAGSGDATCRLTGVVVPQTRHPFPATLALRGFPSVDPDTVTDSLVGVFRLTRNRLTRPLHVVGMLVLDSDLLLGADLRLTGVLIARGSVRPAAGRLDVTGAVVTGDAGGSHSGLGAGDRVRYDACAIRRAVEHVTRPGPSATWTHLRLF